LLLFMMLLLLEILAYGFIPLPSSTILVLVTPPDLLKRRWRSISSQKTSSGEAFPSTISYHRFRSASSCFDCARLLRLARSSIVLKARVVCIIDDDLCGGDVGVVVHADAPSKRHDAVVTTNTTSVQVR